NITLSIIALLFAFMGCTDLEEVVIDESLTGTGQAEVVSGSVAPVYGSLRDVWLHTRQFGLQEVASEEAILPYRGGTDWYDGGKFIAVHQHLMTPSNGLVTDTWNVISKTLSRAIIAVDRLRPEAESGNAKAQEALNEMVAMKAYLNMLVLDNWGIVFKKDNPDDVSEILRTGEAVAYIESELLSVVDVMVDTNYPGRLNKNSVKALLARLYLNAAVYRDPYGSPAFQKEEMDKVIQYTKDIISGPYSLSSEYFDLFSDDNSTNPELIFALDQRGVLQNEHQRWAYFSISGDQIPRPEFPSTRGTDAIAATPSFYRTWVDAYGSVDPAEADARVDKDNSIIPEQLQDSAAIDAYNGAEHYYCVTADEFAINRALLRGMIWGPRKDNGGTIIKCDDGRISIYPVINRSTSGANLQYA